MNVPHPLTGVMAKRNEWDIRQRLQEHPPTKEQLIELAVEEFCGVGSTPGRDRLSVYDILSDVTPADR